MRRILLVSALASIGLCAVVLFFLRLDREVEDVRDTQGDGTLEAELECLTKNVYFEARSEPEEGQRLVADVTLRRWRAQQPRFGGPTLCGVVYHKTTRLVKGKRITTAQFSWTLAPADKQIPHEQQKWELAQRIAREAMRAMGSSDDASREVMWYMNPKASDPHNVCWFRRTLVPTGYVGRHQVFREAKSFFDRIELLVARVLPQCRQAPKEKKEKMVKKEQTKLVKKTK